MAFKDWWKEKSYWLKLGIIGFLISLVLVIIYTLIGLFQGANLGTLNSALIIIPILLLPLTILFGLIGSIIDFVKNKKIIPLILFIIFLIIIIALCVYMYYSINSVYVG